MAEGGGYRYRSLFWPVVLIGVGVVWLLANLGVISGLSVAALLRFWPLVLVFIGLDLLIGHRALWVGGVLGLLAVAVAVVLYVGAANWGWGIGDESISTHRYTEAVGNAASAEVRLDLSAAPSYLTAAEDAAVLFDATITDRGEPTYEVSGGSERRVGLSLDRSGGWFDWSLGGDLRWDVRLGRGVPLALRMDRGSGSVEADLRRVQLTALTCDGGSGSMKLLLGGQGGTVLPLQFGGGSGSTEVEIAEGTAFEAEVNMGSGGFRMTLGPDSMATVRCSGGSGGFRLDVPDGAALQVEVRDSGSGSVRLPSGMSEIRRGDGDEGLWETPGFAGAADRVTVIVESMGSGSVRIQ
ncbi:MAG: hypothetical protein GXX83_04305 [Gaiellales bacterium]|nr:hypothetical protein [Gaiellales bacterium]